MTPVWPLQLWQWRLFSPGVCLQTIRPESSAGTGSSTWDGPTAVDREPGRLLPPPHFSVGTFRTSSSTSTRTYCRVRGWLSRWRTVVISASLMRLSWQSMTLFRMVLRPPRMATTSGFFRAEVEGEKRDQMSVRRAFIYAGWAALAVKVWSFAPDQLLFSLLSRLSVTVPGKYFPWIWTKKIHLWSNSWGAGFQRPGCPQHARTIGITVFNVLPLPSTI